MVYDWDEVAKANGLTHNPPINSPINPSGGVNEAGFAISCTSVYEDFMPIHEALNINTHMIQESLEKCVTLSDYDNLIKVWNTLNRGKFISGNFVVIAARGASA